MNLPNLYRDRTAAWNCRCSECAPQKEPWDGLEGAALGLWLDTCQIMEKNRWENAMFAKRKRESEEATKTKQAPCNQCVN